VSWEECGGGGGGGVDAAAAAAVVVSFSSLHIISRFLSFF
jgi:hypothetical protein